MLHDYRRENRYPLTGRAELTAGEEKLCCDVVDVSMGGLSIAVLPEQEELLHGHRSWNCHLDSPDLPAPIDCVVRVVRKRLLGDGVGLGCEIAAIDENDKVLLNAYRSLAIARENPRLWAKDKGVPHS